MNLERLKTWRSIFAPALARLSKIDFSRKFTREPILKGEAGRRVSEKVEARRRDHLCSTAASNLGGQKRFSLDDNGQGVINLKAPTFDAPIRLVGGEDLKPGITFDQAMESYGLDSTTFKEAFAMGQGAISDDLFNWYSSQGFIGYQTCAIASQHWLINKALSIPAKDAVRNGYDIGTDDGTELDVDFISEIRKADKRYQLIENLVEFETDKRRFGYRLAIFVVESDDPDYYRKPFNIDGVRPGSYKGITQVDPSWVAPILDQEAAANPASMRFYEPTWWLISGQLYHHSHLIVSRYVSPPDILKPTYQYGGIPLTQLILERVYAAERTANEAPMLVETKRLNVVYTNLTKVAANPAAFEERLAQLIGYRDNYGVFVGGLEDRIEQIDTALGDLDNVIMTQYQLVAAVAEMPATKLLGTSPKGFNATGEFELKTYYGLLESVQTGMTLLIERHHQLLIRSEFREESREVTLVVNWNPVDSPSAKETAEVNLMEAQRDQVLVLTGAIDADDIRNRIISDPRSGYTGIDAYGDDGDDDLDFSAGSEGIEHVEVGSPDGVNTIQEVSLAGVQITALVDIVAKVQTGEITKAAAREIILVSFPIDEGAADKLLKDVEEGSREPKEPEGLETGSTSGTPGRIDESPEGDIGEKTTDPDERPSSGEDGNPGSNILGYVSIKPEPEIGSALHAWAAAAGIERGVRPSELHVTVVHSTAEMSQYARSFAPITVTFTGVVDMLENALVLRIDSPQLRGLHEGLIEMGAKSIYPDFQPHITFKYDPEPGDLEKLRAAFKATPLGSVTMAHESINMT